MFSNAAEQRALYRPRFVDLTAFGQARTGVMGCDEAMMFMVFLARGAGVIHIGESELPLLRSSACLSTRRPEVAGPLLRGWVTWVLSLDVDNFRGVLDGGRSGSAVRTLPAGVAMRCEGFFEALEAELDRGKEYIDVGAIQALVDLILLCFERSPHPEREVDDPSPDQTTRAHQLVNEILEIIDGHYGEQLSLADIASRLNRSASSLSRASRTVTGRSVNELIAERRIKEAQVLLLGTTLSVGEVAVQVGYPNPNYFHRAFRRGTSLTPRAWRAEASRALGEQ